MKFPTIPGLAAAVLGLWLAPAPRAEAAFIATMQEVGADVVVTGSGTFNLAALTFAGTGPTLPGIRPNLGILSLGPPGLSYDAYSGATFTGPGNFGGGDIVLGDSGSGDMAGVAATNSMVRVPSGYVNGTALAGTATFLNENFATLGVTPGTYVWTWGEGETLDSFTLNIVASVPVPEPGTLALLGAGLVGLAAARRRKAA